MKWIKYKIEQSIVDEQPILIDKKIGYSEANLAIAQNEAYKGQYIIEEDGESFDKKPLTIELGGTSATNVKDAWKNLGLNAMNLLDNSDFTNPVNQRGVSGTINVVGYFLDRWKLDSGDVTIDVDGIILNGTISQILEHAPGDVVTATADVGEASFDTETNTFTLTASGEKVKWAALYEGEYTADTLPLYTPKGYAAELAECYRYYIRLPSVGTYALPFAYGGIYTSATTARYALSLPANMRIAPTVNTVNINWFIFANGNTYSVTNVSVFKALSNVLHLTATGSGFPIKYAAVLYYAGTTTTSDCFVEFSADL